MDVIEFASLEVVALWTLEINEADVILVVYVRGEVYEGLLEPYADLFSDHLLRIRIPMIS